MEYYLNWNYDGTGRDEKVYADEADDYVLYTVSTGCNYYTDKEDDFAREAKEDFLHNFPEYAGMETSQLQALPKEEIHEITEWFFSGNWILKKESEEDAYCDTWW